MSKLSEILAANRLANQQAKTGGTNAAPTHEKPVENSTPVAEKTVGQISPSHQSGEGDTKGGGNAPAVSGNGPVGEQEKPAVLSAGLSFKEKLAQRWKQNGNTVSNSVPITQTQTQAPVQQVEKNGPVLQQVQPITQDRHGNVGSSTGTIDGTELRKNLDFLAANIEQQELVRQVVATIAIQLRQNPALKEYMKDADVDLVVRGLRRSYNVAKRAKTEKAEAKTKKKQVDLDLDKMLGDMGIDLKL